ncbi:MAG: hypothetical protein PHI37_05425 [Candidatus Gracilibacteria bacterium]|nr:hypothetical protein [Candidatus Gracilibacteria bacterium]
MIFFRLHDLGLSELDRELQTKISDLALSLPGNRDVDFRIGIEVDKIVIKIEQAIDPIEILKLSNHPKAKALYDWLMLDDNNILWYKESLESGRFGLVENGIRLGSSFFFLEDEVEDIKGDTISSFDIEEFKNYTSEKLDKSKKVPYKWKSYIDALPGNDENKILFFMNVLGLNKGSLDDDGVIHISYWGGLITYDGGDGEHFFMVYKKGKIANLGECFTHANRPRIRCIKS